MTDIAAFILQFISSLNYRLKGLKCPYCGREVEIAAVKLGCCRKLLTYSAKEKNEHDG